MPKTNGQPTPSLKAAPINSLHKAVRLLGGTEQRRTSGHNYVLFRLPNGKHIQLPYQRKAGSNGETGRGHLKNLITQITDAGIPTEFVTQALDYAGVTWHTPPPPNPTTLQLLKSRTDLIKRGQWQTLQKLAQPNGNSQLVTQPTPTPPTTTPLPNKRIWSGLSLNEVVQLDLPNNPNQNTVAVITRSLSRMLGNPIREPFTDLINSGHVVRRPPKTTGAPIQYKISETAASILAGEARTRYEAAHPHTETTPPLEDHPTLPAPTDPPAPQAQPEPEPEPEPTPAPPPPPAAAPPAPGETLELNEAIGALIARYGVTPPLDQDLRLDLKAFIINLETATRNKA